MKFIFILAVAILLGGCQKVNAAQPIQIKSIKNGKVISKKLQLKSTTNTKQYSTNTIDTTGTKVQNYSYKDGSRFNSKSEILIKFKENIDIKTIETNYNLKFKNSLPTGDMLFENMGLDSLLTINKIINDMPQNIIRIQPNKTLNMSPR